MEKGPWFVWTGRLNSAVFNRFEEAFDYCRTLTNDHRRKYEMAQVVAGAHRYVGPRGRRHGTRLVAFICTSNGAELIGIDVQRVYGNAGAHA